MIISELPYYCREIRKSPVGMDSDPTIKIRLAGSEDAPAIAPLLAESFAEYRQLYTMEGFAATAITSEQITARLEEGPVWVALSDEMVVGTVSVVARSGSLYIRGMAVRPSSRGQCIGELLLAEVEKFAVTKGLRRLFLSTTPFLNRAIRLYERHGFRRIDEGPTDLLGTPLFTMEKVLRG
jgi:N-acetylglutamate synthase-like GNAT family acetyltransferase